MKLKPYALNIFGALGVSAGLASTLAVSPASGAVVSVSSSSTVFVASFTTPVLSVGPLFPAAGSDPPAPYSTANGIPSVTRTIGPISVTTGLLQDTASGNKGTGTATAMSTLASLDIALDSVFTLTATAVSSKSSVTGAPSATGSTTLANLVITVLGSSVTIPVTPPANDVIFDTAGLEIILNQQIPDTHESAGITTNAIAIDFTKFPSGINLVNGDIDIAQSMASINVIPEPSTWVMMLLGFAGLGYAGYRKARVGRMALAA
jgi:hypothetical protein